MKKLGIVILLPHPPALARMLRHRSRYYPRNTAELGCHPSWALSIILQSSLEVKRVFAPFAESGIYRVRNRSAQSGLLVIGTYVHYRYVRVGSSGISTAGDCTYRDIPEYCEIVDGSRVLV